MSLAHNLPSLSRGIESPLLRLYPLGALQSSISDQNWLFFESLRAPRGAPSATISVRGVRDKLSSRRDGKYRYNTRHLFSGSWMPT